MAVDQLEDIARYYGGSGASDGDTIFTTGDVSRYDEFVLMSTAGAMEVYPALDGTNYATAPLSLIDMGATSSDPVTVTAANRIYGFFGTFAQVKIKQSGATAVANAALLMSRKGGH